MIIDASVAVHWIVETPLSDAALAYRGRQIEVPWLFFSEVGNALCKYVRAGMITEDMAASGLETLATPLVKVASDRELAPEALRLAVFLNHPIYDCLYLALAQRRGSALVTADTKLADFAQRLAVDVRHIRPQATLT